MRSERNTAAYCVCALRAAWYPDCIAYARRAPISYCSPTGCFHTRSCTAPLSVPLSGKGVSSPPPGALSAGLSCGASAGFSPELPFPLAFISVSQPFTNACTTLFQSPVPCAYSSMADPTLFFHCSEGIVEKFHGTTLCPAAKSSFAAWIRGLSGVYSSVNPLNGHTKPISRPASPGLLRWLRTSS